MVNWVDDVMDAWDSLGVGKGDLDRELGYEGNDLGLGKEFGTFGSFYVLLSC